MEERKAQTTRRWGQRGLSTPIAAVVMLVVILVVGALGYVGFNGTKTTSVSLTTCAPSTSPTCTPFSNTHDVALLVPFHTVQQGNLIPFTANLPSGENAQKYTFFWGDGSNASSTIQTQSHAYANPGVFIASALAWVNGVAHDSYRSLVLVSVAASYQASAAGNSPAVAGKLVANTTSTTAPTAILAPGGWIQVSGSYTGAPTNPQYSPVSPTVVSSNGGAISGLTNTTSTASAKVTFANSGTYTVVFVGKSQGPGTSVAYQNYTWTVFVSPTGLNSGVAGGLSVPSSPHKGSLVVYEYTGSGSTSEDPAIDYETVGFEPIINVYQTLITYNGSQTGPTYQSYVPEIATCVPGSPLCQSMYSSTLINQDNYTFVVGSTAQFYDPGTQKSWGVWPTDVLFSVARTMAFAALPCFGCNNGWILAQALLSPGNGSWDSGYHGVLNNTPENVFASVTVNDSVNCPATAMTSAHGCVTFHANAAGHSWPYFLELIQDGLGGSIVPCGWFSANAQAAGIPYWTAGNVSGNGDHPCPMPGVGGYGVAPSSIPLTGWDNYEVAGSGMLGSFIGNVQWHMVGSGPYYMKNFVVGNAYTLAANPAYGGGCTWSGCQPAVGQYAKSVSVVWELTSPVPGEQAYAAGAADFAGIPNTDTALLLQLIQQGKVSASSFPSISIFFFPYNFLFNAAGTARFTSNPVTVPQDWFSHVGVRKLFSTAYPYTTIQSTINTKDGIQYLFNYGGAIPQFMANYYPTNVSFPSTDPCTDATNAACPNYWWAQLTTVGSPFYDSEVAACTPSAPCQLPLFGQTAAPDLDQRMALWAASINQITGGAIKVSPIDVTFFDLVINSLYSPPGQNPMPFFTLGWAPDYPDPTDYMVPLYQADGSYTAGDAVREQTVLTAFNSSSCHAWQDFSYWSRNVVPDNCQGAAYASMQVAMKIAAVTPAGPERVVLYAMIEQIANELSLYTYWGQANQVSSYASWIDGTTLNANVTIGGGADQTWAYIGGNGVW